MHLDIMYTYVHSEAIYEYNLEMKRVLQNY